MADWIDIILARAISPQGQIEQAAATASSAAARANNVVNNLEGLEERAQSAAETAESASSAVTGALEDINGALESLDTTIDTKIASKMANNVENISISDTNTSIAKSKTMSVTTGGNTNTYVVEKNYTSFGDNEDGSMTQKAIKGYVDNVKTELQSQINSHGGGGGGVSNLGSENSGSIVIVGQDGSIVAGDTSEQTIIEALIRTGIYQAKNAVGLSIDYENKNIGRTQEATNGTNFNNYSMYGGRMRCNVADNGTITAFYGDSNYREDGSNGQVMIYQPKFYYQRVLINTTNNDVGKIVRKESLIISPTAQSGFKLHPAFIDENGQEINYILLSAYEGCAFDTSENQYITNDGSGVDFNTDKLSSIANAKPISGERNSLTITNAERLATNRGEGWHIANLKVYSIDQMLSMIEYGTLNIQNAIEVGISNLQNSYINNYASNTGSTSSLGNSTGAANSTTNITNGITNTYGEAGKRAISYRGEENPFGNIWKFIGGINIAGDGTNKGGIPYICKNYNYSTTITQDYEDIGICMPNNSDWISGMGYGKEKYDWIFIPVEASGANSATPVGDYIWVTSNLNETHYLAIGGNWLFTSKDGMFYYACDKGVNYSAATFGARLMFAPTKNSIHDNNYALWQQKMGG